MNIHQTLINLSLQFYCLGLNWAPAQLSLWYFYFDHNVSHSYNHFEHILTILSGILMGWKAKLVFGLINWWDLTSYQPQFTRPNVPNPIYWTKFVPWGLNQIYQIYWTIFNKPKLQNWIYKIKYTKQSVSNYKNQIYRSNLFNQTNKTNSIHRKLK